MDYKIYVRDVRSFGRLKQNLIQMQEQLSQRWLSCIWHATTAVLGCYYSCLAVLVQLSRGCIRFCIFGYFACRHINIMFIFGHVHNIL